jgi:hypothetical protein
MASAISGSVSAREAVNNVDAEAPAVDRSVADMEYS